jgi:polar amino acid transport system substrate-binding protein
MGGRTRSSTISLLAIIALVGSACTSIPRDSGGALSRIRGGVLRAGVIEHPPWTAVDDHNKVSGVEAQLIEHWASDLGARVEWRHADLDELVEALHHREIDVLAAGLHDATPYAPKLALTQPYAEVGDGRGGQQRLVLAVTPGESALLLHLDRFLAGHDFARQP